MRLTANELELLARYMRYREWKWIDARMTAVHLTYALQWQRHERELASRFPQDKRRVAAS